LLDVTWPYVDAILCSTGGSLTELLPAPAHLAETALTSVISRLQSARLPRITLSLSHLAMRVQPVPIESSKPSRYQPLTHTQIVKPAEAAIVLLCGRRDARLVMRKERDSVEQLLSAHDECHSWEVRLHKELSPAWAKSGQSAGAVPRWTVAHNQPIVAANLPLTYTPHMEESTKLSLWSLALHSYPAIETAAFAAPDALFPSSLQPAALRVPVVCWRALLASHVEQRRLLPEYLADVFLFTSSLLAGEATSSASVPPALSPAVSLLKANTWLPQGVPTHTNKRQIAAAVTMDFLTVLAQISHALTTARELAALLDIDTSRTSNTASLPFVGPDQIVHPRISWQVLHHVLTNKLSLVTLATPVTAPVAEKKSGKNKKGSKSAVVEEKKVVPVDIAALTALAHTLSLPVLAITQAHTSFLVAKASLLAPFGGVWPEVELLSKEEEEEEERRIKQASHGAATAGKAGKKDKKKTPVKGGAVEKKKNESAFAALMDDDEEEEEEVEEDEEEEEADEDKEEEAAGDDEEDVKPKVASAKKASPVAAAVSPSTPVKAAASPAPAASPIKQNWADIEDDEDEDAEKKEDGDDVDAAGGEEEDGWSTVGTKSKTAKGIKVPCKWGSRCRERERCKDYHSAEEMAAWGHTPNKGKSRRGGRGGSTTGGGSRKEATPSAPSSSVGSASARGVASRRDTSARGRK
jgi:hypothetical protein